MTIKSKTPKSPLLNEADLSNLNLLITQHSEWAEMRFPDSTAISSLNGDIRESKECIEEIENLEIAFLAHPNEQIDEIIDRIGIEYSDKLLYYLDSIRRFGFALSDIIGYAHLKLEINKNRDWSKNEDNSYSHIKGTAEPKSNATETVYGC